VEDQLVIGLAPLDSCKQPTEGFSRIWSPPLCRAIRSGPRGNVTRRLALCLSAEEIRAKGLDSVQKQHAFQMVNFMLKG
jgi:hypothetical protein